MAIARPNPLANLDATFLAYLLDHIDALEVRLAAAETAVTAARARADQSYIRPDGGAGLDFLSDAARAGLVQTDGTVLLAVKKSQVDFDALPTKVATTLYAAP